MAIDVSRRWFLGGILAVTAAVTVPILKKLPILYGDGIRDDAEGLEAFLSGKPVDLWADDVTLVTGEEIKLIGGRFLLSRGIIIPRSDRRTWIEKCYLDFSNINPSSTAITFL